MCLSVPLQLQRKDFRVEKAKNTFTPSCTYCPTLAQHHCNSQSFFWLMSVVQYWHGCTRRWTTIFLPIFFSFRVFSRPVQKAKNSLTSSRFDTLHKLQEEKFTQGNSNHVSLFSVSLFYFIPCLWAAFTARKLFFTHLQANNKKVKYTESIDKVTFYFSPRIHHPQNTLVVVTVFPDWLLFYYVHQIH